MQRDYDLIVYGSSGFTGVYVVRELLECIRDQKLSMKWAIGGREPNKMRKCLERSIADAKMEQFNADSVQMIVADASDLESLKSMTRRTKVLINCVGPFRYSGHNVVSACIETNTNYVDICGEPQFLEEIQLKHFEEARDKNIYLVPSCGFDSIPCDIGVNFLKNRFDGVLDSVQSFLFVESQGKTSVNATTFDCIVDGYANADKLKSMRKQLFNQLFGGISKFRTKYPLKKKSLFKYIGPIANGYCVPFPGSDRSVVRRTQMHNYLLYKERPVDFDAFIIVPSLLLLLYLFLAMLIFIVFIPFKCGRKLMHLFPELFTLGVFKRSGPTREEVDACSFKMVFKGQGWVENFEDPLKQLDHPPNKRIYGCVSGGNPGYTVTAALVIQSAFAILNENEKMPSTGGVYTPGTAFRNTNLIANIEKRGLKFEVLE